MLNFFKAEYDPIERIWSGAKREPMFDFDCSIGRIIHNNLRSNPKNICQICIADGKTATNKDIFSWSVRLAQNFNQRGLRHDDVICIAAKNSTYVTPVAVACLFNATPFHGVNPTLHINTLTHVLTITKPKLIFCDAIDYEKLKTASAAWNPELITVTGKVKGVKYVEDLLTPTQTEMFYQPQSLVLGGAQTVVILCTSGTTGQPKAVCLANYMLCSSNPFLNSETVVYCGSSVDWLSGIGSFLNSVVDGCTRIIPDKMYSAEYLLELIDKYKINVITCGLRHAAELIACPQTTSEKLSSVIAIALGGVWMPPSLLQKMQSLLKNGLIFYVYGATEFGLLCSNPFFDTVGNSVGKVLAGFKVRIVDDNGKNLGPGEVGEVYVYHGLKWGGYFGNPMETQRMQDPLGWFHTGDLGYFNEDQNLYIVDRKKEIYKCLGMQYSANDIEGVIAELPDVKEVCVVGIYDEKYGEAPAAIIVRRPGSTISADEIKQHVAERVQVEYKQLHGGVQFVNELPTNANGKVLRRVVREQLTQANLARSKL